MHTATVLEKEKKTVIPGMPIKDFYERKMSPEKFFLSLYIFGGTLYLYPSSIPLAKCDQKVPRDLERMFSIYVHESMAVPLDFAHPLSLS